MSEESGASKCGGSQAELGDQRKVDVVNTKQMPGIRLVPKLRFGNPSDEAPASPQNHCNEKPNSGLRMPRSEEAGASKCGGSQAELGSQRKVDVVDTKQMPGIALLHL
jgi:hypothetical protein